MAERLERVTSRSTEARPGSEQTVAAGFALGLVELAMANGVERHALAQRAALNLAELHNPDRRISFREYVVLLRAAQDLCNDPAFALHFGESAFAENGIGCVLGSFADSGAEAFALWNRYSRLCVEVRCAEGADRFVMKQRGGELWIVDTRANANDFPELTELTFACVMGAARRHGGEKHVIKAVHVTHAAPSYRAEYDRIFGVPVTFGSDQNALLLSTDAWLSEKPATSSQLILDVLKERAEALLAGLDSTKSTTGRVQNALLRILHIGGASIDAVAGELGMSRQTLFRHLKAEGTTFERVRADLRHKLALHYLRDKKMSVNETAYLVGFSDRAAFARAFKRWTGSTPSSIAARRQG